MKQTPLYQEHKALGARMAEFGGWDMPIQYEGILVEHAHTRTQVGLFDICHMGEFEISGPSACVDLERLLTCSIASLQPGQCRYGFMLNEQGGVIDDLTCYRLEADRYMLVVNASRCADDASWIRSHLSPGTVFVDLSAQLAKLDVQGPSARAAVECAAGAPLPDLGYFRSAPANLFGCDMLISRTGYTGEFGYELYFPAGEAVGVWRALLDHPQIRPVGLGARDTLRLEMGYSLYGHELSETETPVAVSRGAFIRKSGGYIGEEAVHRDLRQPPVLLVGLMLDSRRAARAGSVVRQAKGGETVGRVTSGALAPSLGRAVALALVRTDFAQPGTRLEVDIRDSGSDAVVVDLPFYQQGTARQPAAIPQK